MVSQVRPFTMIPCDPVDEGMPLIQVTNTSHGENHTGNYVINSTPSWKMASTAFPAFTSTNDTSDVAAASTSSAPLLLMTFNTGRSSLENIEDFLYSKIYVIIAAVGILGNILNIVVLTRRSLQRSMESRMEKSANIGLMSLAVSDLLFCITILPYGFVDKITFEYKTYGFSILYVTYSAGVVNTFIMSSTWLTVFMALSRYLAICHPIKARDMIGLTFTKISMVFIFLVCILFNVPRYWFNNIDAIPCKQGYNIYMTSQFGYMHQHPKLYKAYMWTYFVMCILIPLLVLGVCNEFLIRALNQSAKMRKEYTRKKDHSISSKNIVTRTLVAIVIFYIVLVVPAEVIIFLMDDSVVTMHRDHRLKMNFAAAFLNMLQAVNFSFNFVLYCITNVFFRRTVHDMMTCKRSGRHKALMSRGESMTTYYSNIYPTQSNGRSMSCASRV